jgi:hypothetical protein
MSRCTIDRFIELHFQTISCPQTRRWTSVVLSIVTNVRISDPTLSRYVIRKPLVCLFNITEHKSVKFIKKAIFYQNKTELKDSLERSVLTGTLTVEWNQISDQWDVKLSAKDRTSQPDDGVFLVSISCGRAVSLWDWTESHFPRRVRFLGLQINASLNTWTPEEWGRKACPTLDFLKRGVKIEKEVLGRTNRLLSFDMTRTA